MSNRALVAIYNQYSNKINKWVSLPTPSEYSGISTTLVNSARNTVGQVIADVIASDIAKIELQWNFLTVDEYKTIAQLFEPKYNGGHNDAFFRAVSFFDVIKGGFDGNISIPPNLSTNRVRKFYCGDRKVQFAHIKLDPNTGAPIGYTGVSLHLIDTGLIFGEDAQ